MTDALTYLTEHHVMTLATQGKGGPWAAAVFYVNDGYTLFFVSSPKSRHALDMASYPRVAATVQEDYADWTQIRGVQLEGVVRELTGTEASHARELYAAKFAVTAQPPPQMVAALAKAHWYQLVPERLHFVDNTVAFGHRAEVQL